MREYELVYIIQPDCSPEREKEIQTRVEQAITAGGGQILLWDDWGSRKLAYEIQKFNKGRYMLVSFLGGGQFIPEIERGLRLDPDVLRFLVVKVRDKVQDIEARLVQAREEAAERARKREERERREAERAARAEPAPRAASEAPPVPEAPGSAADAGAGPAEAPGTSRDEPSTGSPGTEE
ncbi:MAG: 30S ribosomal protein S6 [Myxococcota bacterium]